MRLDDQNYNLLYDSKIVGFDTQYWARVGGAADPTGDAGGKLQLTNGHDIYTYISHRYVEVEFALAIPAVPTAGDVRSWGLKGYQTGNRGRMEFNIAGAVFSAVCYDEDGNLVSAAVPITWKAAWTATETLFRISWKESGVVFSIGTITAGVVAWEVVAKFAIQGHDVNNRSSKLPSVLHIKNANAGDTVLYSYHNLTNVQAKG